MSRVVAIDGPSGAGKSTVSKAVAERLGFRFLDTGAIYRAVGLFLHELQISPEAPYDLMLSSARQATITMAGNSVYLNARDVTDAIRTPEAGHHASVYSACKAVRDALLHLQRAAAAGHDIVAEGRDMGTVVFPGAWAKFYLDAREEGRARRRYLQLTQKGIPITFQEALSDVRDRDRRDSERDVAPLRRAEDAVYIDTTDLTLEQVIDSIVNGLPKLY